MQIGSRLYIPDHELEFSYARSSGPGGQNVNKVSSKAILRWNVNASNALPIAVRCRFLSRFSNRISESGEVVIMSDRFRDQRRNREDCLEKLCAMVLNVELPPRPRRKTRPTRSSLEKRKQSKRRQGEKKLNRGRVRGGD